jgi:hypothetical protein
MSHHSRYSFCTGKHPRFGNSQLLTDHTVDSVRLGIQRRQLSSRLPNQSSVVRLLFNDALVYRILCHSIQPH